MLKEKIRIILFLLLSPVILMGQFVTKHNGQFIVHYGSFVKSQAAPTSPASASVSFNIILDYTFESETLGQWDQSEMQTWANTYAGYNSIGDYETSPGDLYNIVYDTIYTGTRSKVYEIGNYVNDLWHGGEMDLKMPGDSAYQELLISYLFQFDSSCYVNHGGKFSGFMGWPFDPGYNDGRPVGPGYGIQAKINFSFGKNYDYHYDYTWYPNYWNPWSSLTDNEYYLDSVYMNHGNWYVLTLHVKLNSFTAGSPNSDAIMQGWINGKMIFNVDKSPDFNQNSVADDFIWYGYENESDTIGLNNVTLDHFYGGGWNNDYEPRYFMTGKYARIVVYEDTAHSTWGTHDLRSSSELLIQPIPFPTNNRFYYDALITTGGSFINGNYSGTSFDTCVSNHYLIDAGPGGTVDFAITSAVWGSSDHLTIYDGDTVTSAFLYVNTSNYVADMSTTVGTISSTQRYMFIRVDHECGGAYNNLTATITLNGGWYFIFLLGLRYKRKWKHYLQD